MTTAQLELITTFTTEVISILSNDWKYTFASNAATNVFGYTPEELTTKTFFEIIDENDIADVIKQTQTVKNKTNVVTLTYRVKHKDGTRPWVENIIRSADDSYLSVARDITARKSSEEMVKRFVEAVENSSDCIIMANPEGKIMYANPSVEELTGYKTYEIIGKHANFIWSGLMDDTFTTQLWITIKETKKPFYGEVYSVRKNGDKYVSDLRVIPILDGKKAPVFYVGTLRDITKAKEVDRMKSEFISLASHQLRTPLTAIKWRLEMLLGGEEGPLADDQHKYVAEINKSNERMIDLVNGLLNISRIESGRLIIDPKPTSLEELMLAALDDVEPKIKEKGIQVHVSFQTNVFDINVDPKMIRNVFMNLLTNAVKYTPKMGEIFIAVYTEGDNTIVRIKDTGLGIPLDQQNNIFGKFFRARNVQKVETEGTGLGLYLVKAIIDASQGRVWFESKENEGTTFWIALPTKGSEPRKGEVSLTE